MLKDKLQSDLKAAMLSGDKLRASTLNMLKSAVLNQEIADGVREQGLSDEAVVSVFSKESKKRLDAAQMYSDSGNEEKAEAERAEQRIISEYLPAQLTEDQLSVIVNEIISANGDVSMKDMGKLIGQVKAKVGNTADGALIATMVKQKLA
jgi:uncharacterized protein YqeY